MSTSISTYNRYILNTENAARAIEQGLAEADWYTSPIPKAELRKLLERRDGPAIRDTLLWLVLLVASGYAGFALWGTWWAVIPFALYGVLYASTSDSRWHESSHGTAFKTDWMNNALYELASFFVMRESTVWRWSHTRHHSDTIIVGRDPEIAVPRPPDLLAFFGGFVSLKVVPKYFQRICLHAIGRITEDERTFIPDSEYGKVFLRARIYVLIYAGVAGLCFYTGSILPLMYVGLPIVYGYWLAPIWGYTQHAGLAENVLDHRLNCRTVYMDPINRFLYWNMNYHVEHHMFPLVPYHALPKLHEAVKADMPTPYQGLLEAWRELFPAVVRQVRDPGYFVKRKIPTPTLRREAAPGAAAFTAAGVADQDGWIEVCGADQLGREDVIRFDHARRTYALYQTAEGKYHATDGVCTHGNTHLADGLVFGNLIECPKHNGRFDITDGSPRRAPVCVNLRTYPLENRGGRLFLNIARAGGKAAEQKTHTFRVVSNRNVATFIKELVLARISHLPSLVDEKSAFGSDGSARTVAPKDVTRCRGDTANVAAPFAPAGRAQHGPGGAHFSPDGEKCGLEPAEPIAFTPGDYLQLDIPAYDSISFRSFDIPAPFQAVWEANHVFDYAAANPVATRRNYSLASNPARERQLRFNVRISAPPRGQDCPAGAGSSYVFSLKPGDTVTAIGPFGDFHIKPTQKEMVYLGGGAGMAPLRAHLSHLFETQQTARKVSFWYGARSRQEIFYQDYFEEMARAHANFSFHLALSEPLPEDGWTSHTGNIHDVAAREYLRTHPNLKAVEFYLCGPPALIQATTAMLVQLGVGRDQIAYDEF